MSTSHPIKNLNSEIRKKNDFIRFLNRSNLHEELAELNINWNTHEINTSCKAAGALKEEGYLSQDYNSLNRLGVLFLSRICVDFNSAYSENIVVNDKYIIKNTIRVGKNSAIFLAEHTVLSNNVVLKFVRPGASSNIEQSLRSISSIQENTNIVKPIDYFVTMVTDIFGESLSISCIVYPYISGETLREFLNKKDRLINTHAVLSFIKQVGQSLYALEKTSLYHGDLHEENIIVNYSDNRSVTFNIIDVSFGMMGSVSPDVCHDNDLAYFRQHLWKMLAIQQGYLPKMSIRKYLGSKVFNIVLKVMSPDIRFSKIVSHVINYTEYSGYADKKKKFIEDKFSQPSLFKLQRYEEITDPAIALRLFAPFPELMDKVKEFSNVFIAGNRGSGKSTYLASLAFYPKTSEHIVDFGQQFGIYFPCRLGEFRLLSSDMYDLARPNYARLKRVVILKIVRRTLEILAEAIEYKKLDNPVNYDAIKESMKNVIATEELYSVDPSIVSEMRNYASTLVRVEMREIDDLYKSEYAAAGNRHIRELDLLNFFQSVRLTFQELANTQFYLLLDDAGQPHVPEEVQRIFNDLIMSSNPVYCIKFTAEKFTYSFISTEDKNLENGHDYFEYDISSMLFIGSKTTGLNRSELEKYFKQIIQKRLIYFKYKSDNIVDYLGNDGIKNEQLINSLASGRRNAYYCGWTVVWNIADRTPRNLLELVSEIFSSANIDRSTKPEIIHNRVQDRAIRIVSEKRLKSLSHIAGVVNIDGTNVSLGSKLYEIASTIGSVYRIYLKEEKGNKRKRQTLAIERNESHDLKHEANIMLQRLITYGVFDSAKLDYARDDQVKKPIYILNRIFCPAFSISYQRDNHLRLSRLKLEQLLLHPSTFISEGTKKLMSVGDNKMVIEDMFGDINGD